MKSLLYAIALSSTFLTLDVYAMDEGPDEIYRRAQNLQGKALGSNEPLPLEYFQLLDQAASAGFLQAQEDLKSNSDVITRPSPMSDEVVWGGNPADDQLIRAIFSRWAPAFMPKNALSPEINWCSDDPVANGIIRSIFDLWIASYQQGDEIYEQAQIVLGEEMGDDKPLPLKYFQLLDLAANKGSLSAQEDLKSHSDVITHPSPMSDEVVWGRNSEDNKLIRTIFARWANAKEEL